MPIVPGVQICTTNRHAKTQRAQAVIEGMVNLLTLRKHCAITRRTFLRRWNKARLALQLTPEYQELRELVIKRCGGKCEGCHTRAVAHVHHIKHVAWHPHLALRLDNCQGLCTTCHNKQHKRSRATSGAPNGAAA